MARSAILAVRIISDARKAGRDLQAYEGKVGKAQRRLQKVTPVAKGVVAGLVGIGVAAGKEASNLQQASGAVESVFGRQAGRVKGLAKNAANSVGLAQSQYSQLAAVLGAQLGNLGVSQGKLVGTTDSLIKQGADMAAMFGGTTSEAVDALSAAFRGETDPIEKYGVSIKQATIQAELHRRGQDKLKGKALQAAKTQATLALITKQTAKAHGQFAREAGSASGSLQIAQANAKNAAAKLGTVLLPVIAKVAGKAAELAEFITRNSKEFTILLGVLGAVAATVLAVNAALSAYHAIATIVRVATIVWRNAQLALNLALMANPVGLLIAAIVIVVGLFILAYKRSSKFRAIVQAVMHAAAAAVGWVVKAVKVLIGWIADKAVKAWRALSRFAGRVWRGIGTATRVYIAVVKLVISWIRSKAVAAWNRLKTGATRVWRAITAPARTLIGWVKSVIGWVRDKAPGAFAHLRDKAVAAFRAITAPIRAAIRLVRNLISRISHIRLPSLGGIGHGIGGLFGGAHASARSPSLQAASGGLTAAAGRSSDAQVVQIVVNGALDPDAVARQIERILSRRNRRLRGASA